MFGMTYRYQLNPEKGTIKLAPTKRMYLSMFAPQILIFGGLYLTGVYLERKDKQETEELLKNVEETPDES